MARYQIAVIGDKDSVLGFKALGLATFPVDSVDQARTTLHTIATGNMTPSYRVVNGVVRPLYFYSVDISEFAVNKLRDRGSLSVKTIVTNVQDFIVHVRKGVCPAEE